MKLSLFLWLLVGTLATGCSFLQGISSGGSRVDTDTQGSNSSAYSEDLSPNRPIFKLDSLQTSEEKVDEEQEEEEKSDQVPLLKNEEVSVLIDSIAALRLNENTYEGLSIEVHSSTKRDVALEVRGTILNNYDNIYSGLEFNQPFWVVYAGKFQNELQALSLLNKIKTEYPNAIIVPKRFTIVHKDDD